MNSEAERKGDAEGVSFGARRRRDAGEGGIKAIEALADPTRQAIVELLAERDRSAGEIASHFRTSRPGISRHLRVLREHGLVCAREEGRRRVYSLDPAPLAELDEWLARYRSFWANRLDALDVELRRGRRKETR